MIARFPHLIEPGQYVKLRGHKVRDHHYKQWWKVTGTDGGTIAMVDRHGKTSRCPIATARQMRWKFLIWEPGDPRDDEQ